MNKRYIDKDGHFWDGKSVHYENKWVINPTEEDLIKAGYTEYVEPEPAEEELLERARQKKIDDIYSYDSSEAVNSFTIGNQTMWLNVSERQQIATQISANEAIGRENMTRWFGGQSFTFPIATWKQMLIALEVYAGDAINVTEGHLAAVNALTTKEEIESYDYTVGYPNRLSF